MKYFLLLLFSFISLNSWCFISNNIIVIDAGSSGTRLFVYKTAKNNVNENNLPTIKLKYCKSINYGIANFSENPDKIITKIIRPLIDSTKQFIISSKNDERNYDIYLYATGGMRLLNNPKKEKIIYSTIFNYVHDSSNFHKILLKTISGEYEGLYAWLDINYLNNKFNNNLDSPDGLFDLGGASFQITFNSDKNDERALKIVLKNNQEYYVRSISVQGMGLNSMRKKMIQMPLVSSCFVKNYEISKTMFGNYNQETCEENYINLLNNPTLNNIVNDIPLNKNFIGVSGLYYNFNFFEIPNYPNYGDIESHINKVCELSWQQLQNIYSKESKDTLPFYCANMTYAKTLLNKIFAKKYNYIPILTKQNFNDEPITWTRGVVLYLSGLK